VASYDVDGALKWLCQAGGTGADFTDGIANGPAQQVYVCGFFNGTVTFGTNVLTSRASQDLFVANLSYDLEPWRLRFDLPFKSGSNTELMLRMQGLTGARSVTLLGSTNLMAWEPILTLTTSGDRLEVPISGLTNRPARFLRALVPE
jgi:hypothetical protein